MKFRVASAFMAAIAGLLCGGSVGAELKNGETVVFLGDSITQAGAGETGYVTLFRRTLEVTRPDSGIRVIGAGISGNRVPDLQQRLDRDVLSHKPSVVVIYIGINDVWHTKNGRGTSADVYEAGLRELVQRCRAGGARVVLCTPSVIGEKTDGKNELDGLLDQYCGISRKVAAETESTLVDLRAAFLGYLREYNTANAEQGVLTTDGVHLNESGNRFVSVRMLEGVGEIAAKKRVLRHVVLLSLIHI
jgi:lysophospholipase L1-like esterase